MTVCSRREFGRIVLAGVPAAAMLGSGGLRARGRVTLGVTTLSFDRLPRTTGQDNLDDIIAALAAVPATHVELALANLEPAPPSTAPTKGGTPAYPQLIILTPAQIAAVKAEYRRQLRAWRLSTAAADLAAARGKIEQAGLTVHACATSIDASWTDQEIDAVCAQVKALGVGTLSTPLTMATAARLVPFADRHQLQVAIHNQANGASGAIGVADLPKALALSPRFLVKFDLGHATASNADAVAALRESQPRLSHVIARDRLRNGGASQYFGEGDTPLAAALDVLESMPAPAPALVEYDYVGLHSPVEEVKTALAYLNQALE